MLNLFQKTSNIHSFNTRSSTSGKFYVKGSRLEIQNNSFSRLGVKQWNKIPRYITDLPKKAYKKSSPQIATWYLRKGGWLYSNPHDYLKSRYIDALAKGFNVCFSFFVLSFKSQWLLFLMHCTSVSAVLIRQLNCCVLFIFSSNLQGFLIV